MTESDAEFGKDMLRGADEIAAFLYNDKTQRRRVYHLVETSYLPIFRLGAMICARKSVLLKWVEEQERRHANDNDKPVARNVRTGNV
jgi:hypothetical protein